MGGKPNRRTFLRQAFAGIAGSALLTGAEKDAVLGHVSPALGNGRSPEDERYWRLVKKHYTLEPGLAYFNNGALGPSPEVVVDATDKFRHILETFPSKYMWGWDEEKEEVRQKAAALLNATPEEIALTHNTTEGLNLVAGSLALEPGDEVIMADHEHQTGVIPFQHFQESRGVKMVRPTLPILPKTPGELVDIYRSAITSRTKAILICHMVNTNGMILPIREVSELAHKSGIVVLVDAAQTTGMLRIDLKAIGCDFFATSAHKWLHAPKGMGIFYARREAQSLIKPMIVSAGYYESDTATRFENYNTRNMPELLGLGAAIDFHNFIGGEVKEQRILELKHYLREKVAEKPFLRLKSPAPDSLSAGITSVELVGADVAQVAAKLDRDYHISCRPMSSHGLNGLRISTGIFNTKEEVDHLISALTEINTAK